MTTSQTLTQEIWVTGFQGDSNRGSTGSCEQTIPNLTVEVNGGINKSSYKQRALLSRSEATRPAALDTLDTVDLFGSRIQMRRAHAWRTIESTSTSITSTRLVPLTPSDIGRRAQAATIHVGMHGHRYQLPSAVRSDLNALSRSTPDSLQPDTSHANTRLTVLHNPDTEPSVIGGMEALQQNMMYPAPAKEDGVAGDVWVGFVVTRSGAPARLRLQRSTHPLLNTAALQAVAKTRFKPGTYNGQPVPAWTILPFTFRVR